jgi:hypothetical protein
MFGGPAVRLLGACMAPRQALSMESAIHAVVSQPPGKETCAMGVYFAGRSRSAEDLIWDRLDRMSNAGPVADYYLAAHERQVRAIESGRSIRSGTGMTARTVMACRRWSGACLVAVGRWFAGTSPVRTVDDARFMTIQRWMAS